MRKIFWKSNIHTRSVWVSVFLSLFSFGKRQCGRSYNQLHSALWTFRFNVPTFCLLDKEEQKPPVDSILAIKSERNMTEVINRGAVICTLQLIITAPFNDYSRCKAQFYFALTGFSLSLSLHLFHFNSFDFFSHAELIEKKWEAVFAHYCAHERILILSYVMICKRYACL